MDETTIYKDRKPLTTDEAWEQADHIWLNAFQCINPTDEFAAQVGRAVIAKVMRSDLRTSPIGQYEGSRAAFFWVNAS